MYLVECKPDAALVKSLTLTSRKNIHHAGNKSELLKRLTEHYSDTKGIVDEDPESNQPPQLQKFKEDQDMPRYGLKILRQTSKNNELVVLCPKLEGWILEAAHESGIDPEKHNLPNDPVKLHRQINVQVDKFQTMLEDLKTRSDRLKELKKHLTTNI